MTNESLGAETKDAITERSQPNVSILILGLAAIVAFFGAVGLVLYLKPGGDSPAPDVFVAGPLTAFPPGTITYFETEHLYLVRLNDGALLALYDLGPRMQAEVENGDVERTKCRAREGQLPDGISSQPGVVLPAGFDRVGFNQLCFGGWWDAMGRALTGPLNGDLDRFPVRVVDDSVHVDVASRRCMNPISPEAPCSPTQ
jgi:hypothetical protein